MCSACAENAAQQSPGARAERQADRESGFSVGHLYRMVGTGQIPNAGRKGAPRIRRRDLPRRPPNGEAAPGSFGDAVLRRAGRAMDRRAGAK